MFSSENGIFGKSLGRRRLEGERAEWDASVHAMYVAMFLDEILERNRTSAIANIGGKLPDAYFPKIFTDAARAATEAVRLSGARSASGVGDDCCCGTAPPLPML